ncbi:MAG: tRNA uridine(34) 5-carboxymethylaminomethyl modification radical SAM/GNAT enzyme Elp3 [Methanobacteriota archaeon]|nr:MAG: tRNA uridine(34) 5-carboxymethylaminomethyl modification radical SAM/GNAT enzyme Elp3 [Euryarchaeota archaeon]
MELGEEIIQSIASGEISTPDQLQRAKVRLCKKYGLEQLPTNSEILATCPEDMKNQVISLLRTKPSRTLSGVAVVAVMTKPSPCPHGKCSYCPGGIEFGTPQSYTGREPAALRAIQHDFDPYQQMVSRLEQLKATGHSVDKVDVIVMGGTFTAFDIGYKTWFVRRCLDGMNGKDSSSLSEAQSLNEHAESRCIGLTIETRPDCFKEEDAEYSMSLGATRIELGVQTTDDDILKNINRGHGIQESKMATKLAKESGLKVCYHMMPGLPGSSYEKDLESFRKIFTDNGYKPDMIKIYPTLVVEGTELHQKWKAGEYTPYHEDEAAKLLADIKRQIPKWVRIQRIQRDIPAPLIMDGVRKGDIRLLAQKLLKDNNERCNCIRCREIGRIDGELPTGDAEIEMKRTEYEASGGTENFISFEEKTTEGLVAYVRLRRSNESARVRELKVLGEVVPIDESSEEKWQHRGYGKKLLEECERIVLDEWGMDEMSVTSGVGARPYYRKLGYSLDGPYMIRRLS